MRYIFVLMFFVLFFSEISYGQFRNMSLSPDSIQEARNMGLKVPYYKAKFYTNYGKNPVGKNGFFIKALPTPRPSKTKNMASPSAKIHPLEAAIIISMAATKKTQLPTVIIVLIPL